MIKCCHVVKINIKRTGFWSAEQPLTAVQPVGEVRGELLVLLVAIPLQPWHSGTFAEDYWWENRVFYRNEWL